MPEKFGELLRKYREKQGCTQWELYGELAEQCPRYTGLRSGSIVSRWERGERKPPPYETILALEETLEVRDNLLLKAAGYRPQAVILHPSGGETYSPVDAIVSMPWLGRRHKARLLYELLGLDEDEIAEKLGISCERVRRDIQKSGKEWEGKMEAKELNKTLKISWLMGRFLSDLSTLDPCHISSVGTDLTESLWVEREPLFPELKKLLNDEFWTKIADWKKARVQYFKECVSFRDAFRQKAEQESGMKTTEYWEKEGLRDTFWQRIYTHIFLKTKPRPLNRLDKDYLQRLETTEFIVETNCLIVKRENSILAEGEPSQLERVSKAYWSLVADFTSSSEPKQIWAIWQELDKTEGLLYAQAEAAYKEIDLDWFRCKGLEF